MNKQVYVQWDYPGDDITGYLLNRSEDSGSSWPTEHPYTYATTDFIDSDVEWCRTYWYKVAGTNVQGTGSFSDLAEVYVRSPAFDIPQLTASQVPPHVSQSLLQWNYSGSQIGTTDYFVLSRSIDSGSTWNFSVIIDGSGSSWVDGGLTFGQSYWYQLFPHGDFGLFGLPSNISESYISDWPSVPAPMWVSALQDPEYSLTASLIWQDTGSVTEYEGFSLERAELPSMVYSVIATNTSQSLTFSLDTNVTYSHDYMYQVRAYSGSRFSAYASGMGRYIYPPPAQLYAWQDNTNTTNIALWNFQGHGALALYRSIDDGATWPVTYSLAAETYYYYDSPVVVGQTYSYMVQEVTTPNEPLSNTASVTVQGTSNITRLVFSSDVGFEAAGNISWESHTASLYDLNNKARLTNISKFLTAGDNACQGPTVHEGYTGQCFKLIGPSESLWAAMGNHDNGDMGGPAAFTASFGYPNEYYTWTQGPIQGFVLYETWETGTNLAVSSAQWTWLSESLSSSMQDPSISWRIVQVHAPAVTSRFSHPANATLAAVPWEAWGVNVVYQGHNHVIERCESGSVAFITCAGLSNQKRGYALVTPSSNRKWWWTDATTGVYLYNSGYVYQLIEATDTYMSMSFYTSSVKLADTGSTAITHATMSGYSLILTKQPPDAPINLAVSSGSSILTWNSSSNDEDYFAIQSSLDGVNFFNVGTASLETYTDTGVSSSVAGNTYWYKVAAINTWGTSSFSNTASILFQSIPLGPYNLQVSSGSAILTWEHVGDQDYYAVQRSLDDVNFTDLAQAIPETYTDTGVISNYTPVSYSYRVAAVDEAGTSSFSNTASITFQWPPLAPINLVAISGSSYTNLTWDSGSNGSDAFSFERSFDGGATWISFGSVASPPAQDNTGVSGSYAGNTYYYRCYAFNAAGNSPNSETASITYTFPPAPPMLSPIASGSAIITWVSQSNFVDRFLLWRSFYGTPGTFEPLAQVAGSGSSYTDTDVTCSISGQDYWYAVDAANAYGTSSLSNTQSITFTCTIPPLAPLLDSVDSGSAILNWSSQSNDQTWFAVHRSITGGDTSSYSSIIVTTGSITTYTDSDVSSSIAGNTYWYAVTAINDYGTSSFSNTASITFTQSVVPPASACKTSPFLPQLFTGSLSASAPPSERVVNGGFETGNFTGWVLSPGINYTTVVSGDATRVHAGTYGLETGPSPIGYMSQSIVTSAGQTYTFSYWLYSDAGSGTEFIAYWNGVILDDFADLGAVGWTQHSHTVTASGSASEVKFGMYNSPAYWGVDDISVIG